MSSRPCRPREPAPPTDQPAPHPPTRGEAPSGASPSFRWGPCPMYRDDISLRYMELSATGYVILGLLSWRQMSGYDIKATVDNSTRFFWAASYGQIYPELRRL